MYYFGELSVIITHKLPKPAILNLKNDLGVAKVRFFFLILPFFFVSAAFSEEEVNMWITGLNWLMIDTQRAPAPQQIDRCVCACMNVTCIHALYYCLLLAILSNDYELLTTCRHESGLWIVCSLLKLFEWMINRKLIFDNQQSNFLMQKSQFQHEYLSAIIVNCVYFSFWTVGRIKQRFWKLVLIWMYSTSSYRDIVFLPVITENTWHTPFSLYCQS